jgi:hypothetical protein
MLGWTQVLATPQVGPFAGFAWLANPAIVATWLLVLTEHGSRRARATALGSVLLAAGFLLAPALMADEAGHLQPITGHRIGYWLWLTSALVGLLAAFLTPIRPRQINDPWLQQITNNGRIDRG